MYYVNQKAILNDYIIAYIMIIVDKITYDKHTFTYGEIYGKFIRRTTQGSQ